MGLKKYVISGEIIEVYNYSQYNCGKGGSNRGKGKSENIEKSLENYANTNQRRRDMVRRLACSNFDSETCKFFTLTFADNLTDVKKCNRMFAKFMMKLNYKHHQKIKYLAVVEFQERGAVHYHVLSDMPYIPQRELQEIWGHGFVYINAVKHVDNIGAYIVKYMSKNTEDTRLQGLKAYLYSRNLVKPYEIVNHDLKEFELLEKKMSEKYQFSKLKPVFVSNYDTEKLGSCEYIQYNLRRKRNDN